MPFYGLRLSAEYVGILALAAFGSAYFAEIIRAGIDAVPKGQLESARAIGMTDWQAMKNIILPQTISIVLPATYKPNTDTYKRISCFINYYGT